MNGGETVSNHSEQVMKQRKKLKRVELLFRPEDYAAVRAAAGTSGKSIAAYIKSAIKLEENK